MGEIQLHNFVFINSQRPNNPTYLSPVIKLNIAYMHHAIFEKIANKFFIFFSHRNKYLAFMRIFHSQEICKTGNLLHCIISKNRSICFYEQIPRKHFLYCNMAGSAFAPNIFVKRNHYPFAIILSQHCY